LCLLERRGIALTDDGRSRIAACTDVATLGRWFDRALDATTTPDVFA
jgi:hypothetical protein